MKTKLLVTQELLSLILTKLDLNINSARLELEFYSKLDIDINGC